MSRNRSAIAGAVALVVSIAAAMPHARACAVCNCGDPTLTTFGIEKPNAGRVRLGLDARYRTDAVGRPGVDRIELDEIRTELQSAWAPTARIFLLASAPFSKRWVGYENGGLRTTFAFGDAELRAKAFVLQDRAIDPRHLFAVTAGIKMPTGPRISRNGVRLPLELQPGTGTWDALAGVSHAVFLRPWSFYGSALASTPLTTSDASRPSASLRGTLAAQLAVSNPLAVRAGADARLDGKARENGASERDSGGGIVYAALEVLVSPSTDWLVVASARVPVLERLHGFHHEGPIFGLAAALDL